MQQNNPLEVVGQQLAKPVERLAVRSFAEVNDVDYLLRHAGFVPLSVGISQLLLHQIEGEQELVLRQEVIVFLLQTAFADDILVVEVLDDVEVVKDRLDMRTALLKSLLKVRIHVACHRFHTIHPVQSHMVNEVIDHLFLLALLDPEDVSCFQVDNVGGVFVTVMKFEFIDSQVFCLLFRLF